MKKKLTTPKSQNKKTEDLAKNTTEPTDQFLTTNQGLAGSRGYTDLARDVKGFSVMFYTEGGNYDLLGHNIPVFFIQHAMKFPDFVHAVKPEPHHEMPQAASAHDAFWDFISFMWTMSDRTIPAVNK